MSVNQKKYFSAILVLGVASAFILLYQFFSSTSDYKFDPALIPMRLGEWEARDIPMDKKILDILDTQAVLVREYTNTQGNIIYLTVVYYVGNRVEFHLPERCSVGQGSSIVQTGKEKIQDGGLRPVDLTANKLIVRDDTGRQIILYYFQSGKFVTSSYFDLKLHMLLNKLRGNFNSGALVKFSAPLDDNPSDSLVAMRQFIAHLHFYLTDALK